MKKKVHSSFFWVVRSEEKKESQGNIRDFCTEDGVFKEMERIQNNMERITVALKQFIVKSTKTKIRLNCLQNLSKFQTKNVFILLCVCYWPETF